MLWGLEQQHAGAQEQRAPAVCVAVAESACLVQVLHHGLLAAANDMLTTALCQAAVTIAMRSALACAS
jgi:hypothetical protein